MELRGCSRRLAVLALSAALGGSAEASAAPTPLLPARDGQAVALAGDEVLLTRVSGPVLRVLALPISGRGRLAERFRFTGAAGETPSAQLHASDSTAALLVRDERDDMVAPRQVFAGPVTGPFTMLGAPGPVAADGYVAQRVQVDGNRVFTTERSTSHPAAARIVAYQPGAAPLTVALPADVLTALDSPAVTFAGDFVAYAQRVAGQPRWVMPRRVVVLDWRTGAPRSRVVVDAGVAALDLAPDGRVVLAEGPRRTPGGGIAGGVLTIAPGARTARRVSARGGNPQFADSRIVFVDVGRAGGVERLMVAAPDGPPRPFGVRTAHVANVVTDAQRVVWTANRCVLTAPLSARAASAPARGSCPRSEVLLDGDRRARIGRDRRVSLTLRCIAAAPAGCRGTVRVYGEDARSAAGSARFRIAVGRARSVSVRLDPAGYRFVRRDWLDGGAVLVVRATAVDPAGRRTTLSDGVPLDVAP